MPRVPLLAALCLPLALSTAESQPQRREGPSGRPQLEQQLRRRMWEIARERVRLTDDQMARLEAASRKFDVRRRALGEQEREQRAILRAEILADTRADQSRIATALDRLLVLQRDRLDVQEQEQREFASFMTPIQRAKYAALQEQLRRRAEALRRQRPESGWGSRPP